MGVRVVTGWAVLFLVHACGGSEFGSSGTGGSAGSGGSSTTGGSGGAGGTAATGGGGTSAGGGSGGTSGTGGVAGSGGTSSGGGSGDSGSDASSDGGTDASSDAGPPPIVVVQASPLGKSTATSNITLSAQPKPGNAIIVGVTCISDHGVNVDAGMAGDCVLSNGTVTDNRGNTYSQIVQGASIQSSQQGARGYIFIAENINAPTGSFTITVDPEGSSTQQSIVAGAIEVSGLKPAPSFDVSGYTAVHNTVSTNAMTFQPTTQANELAVAVLSIRHNDVYAGIVPDSSWTSHHIHQDSVTGPPAHSMVSKVLTSTGKASHVWAHVAASRGAAGIIATFKGAAQN